MNLLRVSHRVLPGHSPNLAAAVLIAALIIVLSFPMPAVAEEQPAPEHLTLGECIDIALTSSPDILAAGERVEQARAAVEQARAGYFPRLSLRETLVRTDFAPMVFSNMLAQGNLTGSFPAVPPPGFDPFAQFNEPGPLTNWNTQLLVELPLFRGGGTYYGHRAAGASLDAAEFALATAHNDLAFGVSAAYYEILKTQLSIQIAEESVRQLRSHLDVATARVEAEVALKSDMLRVAVQLSEAEEGLERARHNLERARSRLNLAMGRPVNDPLLLTDSSPDMPDQNERALDDLIALARLRRPEIEGMERNVAALGDSVRVARAGYYPRVDAFAHYDIDTEDFSDSGESWTIGASASVSIFDGFLTRSTVRAAQARLREAEERQRRLALGIDMEVKDAYLAKSEAARRIDVLRDSVGEAEETARIVSERYAEGMALVTELLDAEVALTNTRLHMLSARYDHLVAGAALDRAVGVIMGGR